jgi:putative ABC transport system permease protein
MREVSERQSGRAATMSLSVSTLDGTPVDQTKFADAFDTAVDRYDITWFSERSQVSQPVRFADGRVDVPVEAVDIGYGEMHRVKLVEGAWFTEADRARMAPALIVNERFWERMGAPDLRTHPTVVLPGEKTTVAVVVGVTPSSSFDTMPSMYMLGSQYRALATTPAPSQFGGSPQYEVWVPDVDAEALGTRLAADIGGLMGENYAVSSYRSDYAEQNADSLAQVQLIIGGIALLVLLLGALGLVNIALVTVRARIREIGIRRTFGATAGRVFFSVLMESVVATVVAGVVGVMLAVLVVKNPWTEDLIGQGIADLPPFPVDAAIVGLVSATAVGALAGLIPALVAVRVKVIDAIRY